MAHMVVYSMVYDAKDYIKTDGVKHYNTFNLGVVEKVEDIFPLVALDISRWRDTELEELEEVVVEYGVDLFNENVDFDYEYFYMIVDGLPTYDDAIKAKHKVIFNVEGNCYISLGSD
jgi:hypothetical protein